MATPGAAVSSGLPPLTVDPAASASSSSPSSSSTPAGSSSASSSPSTTVAPTYIFSTPSITTPFTPPAECTEGHITMLERQQYFIWQNEPLPVPNSTFAECYPSQFISSYVQSYSSTIAPAFSPLVCPDNYQTVFSQSMSDRPMYIACCPSSYGLHPPDTSTPGRPAYGATCYSNISSVSVTQYDNSSSSGVMIFSTPGQAYAHPIDGFALETSSSANTTVLPATTSATATATPVPASQPPALSGGAIAGIVVGSIAAVLIVLAAIVLLCARRRRPKQPLRTELNFADNDRYGGPPNSAMQASWVNEKALPLHPPGYSKHAELHSSWPRKPSELSATYTSFHELPDHSTPVASELETDRMSSKSNGKSSISNNNSQSNPNSAWMRPPGGRSPARSPLTQSSPKSKSSSKTLPPLPMASSPESSVSPISASGRNQRFGSDAPSEL